MKTAITIAKLLDSFVSISLLLVGSYFFFILHQFVTGAVVLAAHSLYQIPSVLLLLQKK